MEHSGLAAVSTTPAQEGGRHPAVRSRWWRAFPWTPPRVVLVYALFALLWIAFVDRLLELPVPGAPPRGLQLAKGVIFVLLSSALLYVLVRRAQKQLLTFGTEVRAGVDSMADGVLVFDAEGVVEANRAAVELLGVSGKEELLGPIERFVERFEPRAADGAPIPRAELANALALKGARVTRETVLRRRDGRDVVVSVSAAPFLAPGAPMLSISVLHDVSRAHRLEAMRDEFLATAAHELKTPLAVVKAYAQLVQRRTPSEAPALTVVQRQVDRMTRLVQHLLDASRLRLDPDAGPRERFDLSVLVSEVIEPMREAEPAHALSLSGDGAAMVEGDRDRIARVVHSLLDNAVRFSPRGGPVEVRVSAHSEGVQVSVSDHGLGIPLDRQERIFERYYRAHAGTPEDYGGLGLSLDMSREIVARHGGRIWFESAPGQGSTFHFTLPAAKQGER